MHLPVLVFEIGLGAITPIIPLSAVERGASLAAAGLMLALLAVGQIIGDAPAGAVVARLGDRRAMALAALAAVVVLVAAALAPTVALLAVALLVLGVVNAVFMLARHSYLTEVTPVTHRARALSTLAGVHRIGFFIGPFAGAAAVHVAGLSAAYWLAVATSAVTVVVVVSVTDGDDRQRGPVVVVPVRRVLSDHRHVLATLGTVVVLAGAVRGARQTVLPLWGEHIGLAPATTAIVFGISGAVDMLLFYPAGRVMDLHGRRWTGVPFLVLMAAGFTVLPLTSTVAGITVAAGLLGVGNGIGSGILMTVGSDAAPREGRAQFLGVWRLLQDVGGAAGPLVVAGGAALGSLAAGVWAMAAVSGGGVAGMLRWVPERR